MAAKEDSAQVRPCDVLLKLLMSKHVAPLDENEMEIVTGYLIRLPPEKLGGFAKKGIAEMSDEEFGDLLKSKIEAVVGSKERKKKRS